MFDVADEADAQVNELIEENRRKSVGFSMLSGLTSPIYSVLAYSALLGVLVIISAMDVGNVATLGGVMLVVLRSLSYGQALQGAQASLASNREVADLFFEEASRLEAARQIPGVLAPDMHRPGDGDRCEPSPITPVRPSCVTCRSRSTGTRSWGSWDRQEVESPHSCSCCSVFVHRRPDGSPPTESMFAILTPRRGRVS